MNIFVSEIYNAGCLSFECFSGVYIFNCQTKHIDSLPREEIEFYVNSISLFSITACAVILNI